MSVLASLLVRDNAVPVDRVQEAIQQQVMRGGNLDTILLELDCLPENTMNAYCAAVHSLLPATREEVMDAPYEVTRLLPREFAVKHRAIPVSKTANKVVLVVDRPLPQAVRQEISDVLRLESVQRVVSTARLEAALSHHYDIKLTSRMRSLRQRLETHSAGAVPYVVPYDGKNSRSGVPPTQDSAFPARNGVPTQHGWNPSLAPERERIESPVPAGTFSTIANRFDRPASMPESGEDTTRYSMRERPVEVLGRPFSSKPPNGSDRKSTARLKRVSSAPARERVPSVIVEVGQDVEQLVETLCGADSRNVDEPISLLVATGERALPALVREFPGPLWFDRHKPLESVPAGRGISPIARAFVAFGDRAVPYLVSLLDRPDADVRFYATLLASEFLHPSLVIPLGRRIFDPDPDVATIAFRALIGLRGCHPEFDQLVTRVRAIARAKRDSSTQATAVLALGRLRDADSIEFLISLLEESHEEVVQAAHASLVRLCCQDFGNSARKWSTWVSKNRTSHRVEWLIEGLTNGDVDLRRKAGDELRLMTQEYFGYHAALPKHDREVAQRKYRRWWEQRGRRLFATG